MNSNERSIFGLADSLGVNGEAFNDVMRYAAEGSYVHALIRVREAQYALDALAKYVVDSSRSEGLRPAKRLSWEKIGHALGVTRQAAHAKYAG